MQQIGRYQIIEEIGRGTRGVVFLAFDPNLDRQVALKTFSLSEYDDPQNWQLFSERLLKEAKRAGGLTHPNIVAIYDAFTENNAAYVVMEYIAGPTLDQMLSDQGRLDPQTALQMIREVAAGLDYAHGQGVVHRDIKPANLVIGTANHVKITDFGMAKRLGAAATTSMAVLEGTPEFMSPEQLEASTEVDGRSDQFALGCVAYLLLTGRKPFEGETIGTLANQVINQQASAPSQMNPALGRGVDLVFRRVLSKSAVNRFGSCSDFAEALEGALRGASTTVLNRTPDNFKYLIFGLLSLAAICIVALFTYQTMSSKSGGKNTAAVTPMDGGGSGPPVEVSRPQKPLTPPPSPTPPAPQTPVPQSQQVPITPVPPPPAQPDPKTPVYVPPVAIATSGPLRLQIFVKKESVDKDSNFFYRNQPVADGQVFEALDRPPKGQLFAIVAGGPAGKEAYLSWYKDDELADQFPLTQSLLGKPIVYGNKGNPGKYVVKLEVGGTVRQQFSFTVQ